MTNPWKNIEEAFQPMYDEEIVVTLKNGQQATFFAYICTNITDDPLNDGILDASFNGASLVFKKEDQLAAQAIQRGDKLLVVSGNKTFVVSNMKVDSAMGAIVQVREL